MSYKTILVHIDSDQRCATRVDIAIRMAMQHKAHLVALYAQAPFFPPGYLLEAGPAIVEAHDKAAKEDLARTAEDFTQQVSALGFKNVEWRTTLDHPVAAVTEHAQYADLVIISQSDPAARAAGGEDFPARVVLAAGRPVLLLPYIGSFPTLGNRILVAWNASHEATRAVTDAIPLLRLADKVVLMSIDPEHDASASLPIEDIVHHLARHGVHVEVMKGQGADIDVGNELLSRTADLGSDLLVMGGYGHSRLREWVLGGVTRTLLESMTIPVLMSH